MKKSALFLLTLVPGEWLDILINVLIMVPVIGAAGFYLLPLLTTAFWMYLGRAVCAQMENGSCITDRPYCEALLPAGLPLAVPA